MTVDAGREEGPMGKELTTAELADAVPCPRGSVAHDAALANVQPSRRIAKDGSEWKLWPAHAVRAIRRVRAERKATFRPNGRRRGRKRASR